jgi:hypothetical protein
VRVDDPRVLAGRLRGPAHETLLLVNCSPDVLALEPGQAGEGGGTWPLRLEPYGVATVTLETSAPTGAGSIGETTLAVSTLTKGGMPPSEVRMTR